MIGVIFLLFYFFISTKLLRYQLITFFPFSGLFKYRKKTLEFHNKKLQLAEHIEFCFGVGDSFVLYSEMR